MKSRKPSRQTKSRHSPLICTRPITFSGKAIASWCRCRALGSRYTTATRKNSCRIYSKRRMGTTRKPHKRFIVRSSILRAWRLTFSRRMRHPRTNKKRGDSVSPLAPVTLIKPQQPDLELQPQAELHRPASAIELVLVKEVGSCVHVNVGCGKRIGIVRLIERAVVGCD